MCRTFDTDLDIVLVCLRRWLVTNTNCCYQEKNRRSENEDHEAIARFQLESVHDDRKEMVRGPQKVSSKGPV